MDGSFRIVVDSIPADMADRMRGRSWHPRPHCPGFDDLALLRMTHWTFDSRVADGELVVARTVADDLCGVFAALFAARFPIATMKPIYHFDGDDRASMAANNCSAFNFRTIVGTDDLSQHALGFAVDINPVHNPWVLRDDIRPPAGAAYVKRRPEQPGVIIRPGPVTDAFDAIGWFWGGDWQDVKDFHHFQKYEHRGLMPV